MRSPSYQCSLLQKGDQLSVVDRYCRCPRHIAQILRQVRGFREYTTDYMTSFLEDQETHQWLASQAMEIEEILTKAAIDLMQQVLDLLQCNR